MARRGFSNGCSLMFPLCGADCQSVSHERRGAQGEGMKAGALWGRMVSCGGLATRLPRVGVPSNRWRTADFRECGHSSGVKVAQSSSPQEGVRQVQFHRGAMLVEARALSRMDPKLPLVHGRWKTPGTRPAIQG